MASRQEIVSKPVLSYLHDVFSVPRQILRGGYADGGMTSLPSLFEGRSLAITAKLSCRFRISACLFSQPQLRAFIILFILYMNVYSNRMKCSFYPNHSLER